MSEYGQNIAPLSIIGAFLNQTGNSILNHISNEILKNEQDETRKVFFPGYAVLSVNILDDGSLLTRAFTIDNEKKIKTVKMFKSNAVLLSNGAS